MKATFVILATAFGVFVPAAEASACCWHRPPVQSHLTPLVLPSQVAGLELDSIDVDIAISAGLSARYFVEEVIVNTTDKEIRTKAAAFWCKPELGGREFECYDYSMSVFVDGRRIAELDSSSTIEQFLGFPPAAKPIPDDDKEGLVLHGMFDLTIPPKGRVIVLINGRTPVTQHGFVQPFCFRMTGWPFDFPWLKPFETFGRHRVRFTWLQDLERGYQIEPSPQPTVSGPGFAEWGCVNCKAAPSYSLGLVSRPKQTPNAKPQRRK